MGLVASRGGSFLFTAMSRLALRPMHLSVQKVLDAFFRWLNHKKCDACHSLMSSVKDDGT